MQVLQVSAANKQKWARVTGDGHEAQGEKRRDVWEQSRCKKGLPIQRNTEKRKT